MKILSKIITLTLAITLLLSGSVAYMEPVGGQDTDQEQTVPIDTNENEVGENTDESSEEPGTGEEEEPGNLPTEPGIESMEKVAENSKLELYISRQTAEAAIKVKKTGKIWYTNPRGRNSDPKASPAYKNLMNSQLRVVYYTPASQPKIYYSYTDSVQLGQFEIKKIENGVRIEYQVGEIETIYTLPKVISVERMEEKIIANLSESDGKTLLRYYSLLTYDKATAEQKEQYPSLAEHDIYVLSGAIKDFRMKQLEEIIVSAGYTLYDKNEDHIANNVPPEEGNLDVFFIPLEYRLEDDNLVVSIPTKEIEYDETYPIASIDVLPFFGAAGEQEQGYMLVPDGSGSLIYLNNNKLHTSSYSIDIYGLDRSIPLVERATIIEQAYLPVFGLKSGDEAFFCIIERGEAMAAVKADISGRQNSFNYVYPSFTLIPRDELDISDFSGLSIISVYPPRIFNSGIQLRYAFLDGDASDYSGMAEYYRSYLADKYGLTRLEQTGKVPFYLEIIGAINKVRSILGIPVNTVEPLTTYEQAVDIMKELNSGGVDNIVLRYKGWANGGVDHTIPQTIKLMSKLGGSRGFKAFQSYMKEMGYEYYPDFGIVYAYKDTWFDGFNPRVHASRYITKLIASIFRFNIATNREDRTRGLLYVISPAKIVKIVDGMLKGMDKLGIPGISLNDAAIDVNSNFRQTELYDRQEAADTIAEQMKKIRDAGKKLMVDGGNSYALPYTNYLLNIPDESNRFHLTDESVPFFQMVIRGYIDYAGEPINMSPEYRTAFLKAIETGSGVYFSFIHKENSVVKETLYDQYYSNNYKVWMEDAITFYEQAMEALGPVQGMFMVDHEKLQHDVYKTTYENGREIIVNYNRQPVTIDGVTIEAQSFKVVKEGK